MKYFTKEWYNDSIVSDLCFQLRKTEKAGEYSDKFFEKLYRVEEKAYKRFRKTSARIARIPYIEADVSADFRKNYEDNLGFAEKNIPEEILKDIKDIRVFALGSVTYEIAQRLTVFCGKKNRLCEAVERRYNDASEEIDEKIGGVISKALLSLAGTPIASINEEEGTITIITSHEYTGTSVKITLTDAKVIESDGELIGDTILRHELLPGDNGGFEFSLLTTDPSPKLHTVTFIASDIDAEETFE